MDAEATCWQERQDTVRYVLLGVGVTYSKKMVHLRITWLPANFNQYSLGTHNVLLFCQYVAISKIAARFSKEGGPTSLIEWYRKKS